MKSPDENVIHSLTQQTLSTYCMQAPRTKQTALRILYSAAGREWYIRRYEWSGEK
jgi:hypothetical protein